MVDGQCGDSNMRSIGKIYKGWVTQAWKKEDADARIILVQNRFIGMLCVLSLTFFVGWITSPSRLTIYLPPDIQNGATLKAGSIPDPLIYSFAYEIWQELNYWQGESGDDYSKNINTYWSYLTPQFKAELLEDYADLKASGQVQRIRYLQGLSGAAYDSINVKKIGNDTWEVDLRMRLTEIKNNQVVKDVEIIYPIRITRTNVSPQNNPYGLALAGFISEPQRQKTYI
jgi:integrating conjugative element protein (TIGR03746 family)